MCLMEKVLMSDKICSDMSYGAVGREFNVNKTKIYIKQVSLNRNTDKARLCTDWLIKML